MKRYDRPNYTCFVAPVKGGTVFIYTMNDRWRYTTNGEIKSEDIDQAIKEAQKRYYSRKLEQIEQI